MDETNKTNPETKWVKIRKMEDALERQLKECSWTVYKYDSEEYAEYFIDLIEKVGKIRHFQPDFILCRDDEFFGFADFYLTTDSNQKVQRRDSDMYKLHMTGIYVRLRQHVKLLVLTDGEKFDFFINGTYYGAMDHVLSPDEVNTICLRNITDTEWRELNKSVIEKTDKGTGDKPRTVTFTSMRTETYKCEYSIEIPNGIITDQIPEFIEENKRLWRKSSEKLDHVKESKPEDLFIVEKGQ